MRSDTDVPSRGSGLTDDRRRINNGGRFRPENLDHILSFSQTPQTLELLSHRHQAVRVAVPISEHRGMMTLELLHIAGHPAFQPVRFPTVVEEEHQDVMAAAKDDLVVLELDAPHVGVAHRVERLVHEFDNCGEHRRDEVRIRAGREAAGKVHHRDAPSVDEEDVVHDGADPGHGFRDLRPVGLNASGAVIRDDSRMASPGESGRERVSEVKEVRFPDASAEVELRGIVHGPERPKAGLVIAHGRSNDLRNPLVRRIAEAVASKGIWALRFNFRYVEAKGQASRDLSREEDDLHGAIRFAREAVASQKIFLAGKSMGARVCARASADSEVAGVISLGYPLHPRFRPEVLNPPEWPYLVKPALFVQGDRDPFCDLERLRSELPKLKETGDLVVIQNAGHSFEPIRVKRDTFPEVRDAIIGWIRSRIPSSDEQTATR